MTREQRRVETDAGCMSLDDLGNAAVGETRADSAALPDRAEYRARGDSGGVAPRAHGRDRTGERTPNDCDLSTSAFLIGFGAPDRDLYTCIDLLDIFTIQRNQFGATKCAGKAKQQQRSVAY